MKLTFGIHKNTELSELNNNYKEWLLKQSFFKNRYPKEYDFLKKFKPLKRKINFTDLPCDIKSLIFGINYNAEKSAHEKQIEEDKKNGIEKHGKKGRKQIVTELVGGRWGSPGVPITSIRYINCANCGNALHRNGGGCYDQQHYECCGSCYEQFKLDAIKRKWAKHQDQFCLISDSEDEDE
tara:strand:- start:37 stop:579 length:543 start_codon:yes stop_codon:yes gene_type:complete